MLLDDALYADKVRERAEQAAWANLHGWEVMQGTARRLPRLIEIKAAARMRLRSLKRGNKRRDRREKVVATTVISEPLRNRR